MPYFVFIVNIIVIVTNLGLLESAASLIIRLHLVLSCTHTVAELLVSSSAPVYDFINTLSVWPSNVVLALFIIIHISNRRCAMCSLGTVAS